jgi:pimeloyl-ACP methyl ester carboxylesterase
MRQKLVLLHGALGAGIQLEPLAGLLSDQYDVKVYEFPGHGKKANETGEFSIENLASAFNTWLVQNYNGPVKVFGYSMGGYVGLYLAASHPGLFEKIVTLGTKFRWSVEDSAKETAKLDPVFLLEKAPAYCQYLERLHGIYWKEVLQKTAGLMQKLGQKPLLDPITLSHIQTPVDLLLGELDKMVTREETEQVCTQITAAGIQIIPGLVHPLERLDVQQLAIEIKRYLEQ